MSDDRTGTAAEPTPGQPNVTETDRTATAPAEARVPQPIERDPFYKSKSFILIVLLVIIGLVIWGATSCSGRTRANVVGSTGQPDGTAARALMEATGTVDPAVEKGVTSWTSWGKASLKNRDMEASMIEAHGEKYHRYYAQMVADEKKGKSFKRLYPKGTRFINCDYNVKNDGKYTFFWDTLKKDTWFLVFPDGTPAVKTACGNTIIIPVGKPVVEKPKIPKHHKHKPPEHCTNNTGQYKKHGHQDSTTNVGGTDGYPSRGNAESVVTQQQSEPVGGTTPTTYGTPGTGSGGTTPGGPGSGAPVDNPGSGETVGGTVPEPD